MSLPRSSSSDTPSSQGSTLIGDDEAPGTQYEDIFSGDTAQHAYSPGTSSRREDIGRPILTQRHVLSIMTQFRNSRSIPVSPHTDTSGSEMVFSASALLSESPAFSAPPSGPSSGQGHAPVETINISPVLPTRRFICATNTNPPHIFIQPTTTPWHAPSHVLPPYASSSAGAHSPGSRRESIHDHDHQHRPQGSTSESSSATSQTSMDSAMALRHTTITYIAALVASGLFLHLMPYQTLIHFALFVRHIAVSVIAALVAFRLFIRPL